MKEFHRDFANRTGLAQAWTVKSADRLFTTVRLSQSGTNICRQIKPDDFSRSCLVVHATWSVIQGRPTKAAWFDALVFEPRFGGQNCLFVAQTLQAELVNLMAVRQNLRFQIAVCWLQCLIELAGAGVGDLQI